MLLLCAMSCHTCLLILQHGMQFDDFTVMVRRFLGTRAQYVAWLMSVLVILGAGMAYHILLEETLYNIVGAVSQWTVGHSPATWTPAWAAAVIVLMYPITNLRQLTVLVRINSMGALFIFYVALFIVTRGVQALLRHGTTIPPAPKDASDAAAISGDDNGSILAASPSHDVVAAAAAAAAQALVTASQVLPSLPSVWGRGEGEDEGEDWPAPDRDHRSTAAHDVPRDQHDQPDQRDQRLRRHHVTEQPSSQEQGAGGSGGASPAGDSSPTPPHSPGHLHVFSNSGFAKLGGMGTLSYFIHNALHPILRHCNPETRRVRVTSLHWPHPCYSLLCPRADAVSAEQLDQGVCDGGHGVHAGRHVRLLWLSGRGRGQDLGRPTLQGQLYGRVRHTVRVSVCV